MSTDPLFDSWHSYPSIYALGHRALADLFLDPVIVEEKIDGSQFSFGRFNGELKCRSKGCVLNVVAPERMFQRAVDVAGSLDLIDGWTYRAEYLLKPKHNALAYDRIPASNLIVFDVNIGHESYMAYADKEKEALRLGLDVVPLIYEGRIDDVVTFRDLIDRQSCLGGQKVEGVVVKNYARFGLDKKVLLGKFVSEAFKEVHGSSWREANPTKSDIVDQLIQRYKTPARWAKAVQHLSEAGKLDQSPRDIGLLMKEVWPDIEKECADDIRDYLYAHFADKDSARRHRRIARVVQAETPRKPVQQRGSLMSKAPFNKFIACNHAVIGTWTQNVVNGPHRTKCVRRGKEGEVERDCGGGVLSALHWISWTGKNLCGVEGDGDRACFTVTYAPCLRRGLEGMSSPAHPAHARLAELDYAQAQGGIWVDPSGKHHVEPPIALNDIPINSVRRFTFTPEPCAGSITINVDVPNPTGRPSTSRTVDVSLLTRLSDFIASIPGNALDRKSNALAMTLRREIADVVCPADKVRK